MGSFREENGAAKTHPAQYTPLTACLPYLVTKAVDTSARHLQRVASSISSGVTPITQARQAPMAGAGPSKARKAAGKSVPVPVPAPASAPASALVPVVPVVAKRMLLPAALGCIVAGFMSLQRIAGEMLDIAEARGHSIREAHILDMIFGYTPERAHAALSNMGADGRALYWQFASVDMWLYIPSYTYLLVHLLLGLAQPLARYAEEQREKGNAAAVRRAVMLGRLAWVVPLALALLDYTEDVLHLWMVSERAG